MEISRQVSNRVQSYFSARSATSISSQPANPLIDDISVAQTIAQMKANVLSDLYSQPITQIAQHINKGLGADADNEEKISAVHQWVRKNITFQNDETVLKDVFGVSPDKELLISPARLATMDDPQGDCDDYSQLAAALLLRLGVRPEFVTIAADQTDPSRLSHVYVQGELEDGSMMSCDASHGPYPGWESPRQFRKVRWPLGQQKGLQGMEFLPEDRQVIGHYKGLGAIGRQLDPLDRQVIGHGGLGQDGFDPGTIYTGVSDSQLSQAGVDIASSLPGVTIPPSGGGSSWASVLASGINDAAKIFGIRYGVPQLNQGQYIQQGPQGSVMYQAPAGQGASFIPPLNVGTGLNLGGMMPLLLIGGLGLLVFSAFKGR